MNLPEILLIFKTDQILRENYRFIFGFGNRIVEILKKHFTFSVWVRSAIVLKIQEKFKLESPS